LIGHDEYHFDSNAFEQSYAYLEEQQALIVSSLEKNDLLRLVCFGRLMHTVQDFYAHSNYIDLWLSCKPDGALQTPSEVEPLDEDLIHTRALRSGRIYLPLEALYLIRPLRGLILRILPRDSHAWMNLDSPEQGPNFLYAFQAAIKRTRLEFNKTASTLPQNLLKLFVNM
jgi:hypothetical protein